MMMMIMIRTSVGLKRSIIENVKASAIESLGYYELKQHKSWFDECSELLYQMTQAKLQWLHKPSQTNGMEII